jgi:hypothetical protein
MWSFASIVDLVPYLTVESTLADVNRCGRSDNGVLVDAIFRLDR